MSLIVQQKSQARQAAAAGPGPALPTLSGTVVADYDAGQDFTPAAWTERVSSAVATPTTSVYEGRILARQFLDRPGVLLPVGQGAHYTDALLAIKAQPHGMVLIVRDSDLTPPGAMYFTSITTTNASVQHIASLAPAGLRLAAGAASAGVAFDAGVHLIVAGFAGAASVLAVDGAETVVNPGTDARGVGIVIGAFGPGDPPGNPMATTLGRVLVLDFAPTVGDRAALLAWAQANYGTP